MKVEILTIGDEILAGNIVDTNKAYLSDQLWQNGFSIEYHSGVRDDEDQIQAAFLEASQRADIVIVTGGMGPTVDDFTIEVAAKTFGVELVLDEDYLEFLTKLFKKFGREMKENNVTQACVPDGSRVFKNHQGTAPGVAYTFKETDFYFMPGVPREMKYLFQTYVLPDLQAKRGNQLFFKSKMVKCFGIAESDLDYRLAPYFKDRVNIDQTRIGFRAHFPEVFIKVSAWNQDEKQAQDDLDQTIQVIEEQAGDFIFGEADQELEDVVVKLLLDQKKTVAVAESCTGGLVAHRLTNVPGSSSVFTSSVVTYSNESKVRLLGVDQAVLDDKGAVSEEVARQMAEGARDQFGVDYGLALSGIAGPGGGSDEKPVGTLYMALATKDETICHRFKLVDKRNLFKLIASTFALDWLRRSLLGLELSLKK